MEEENKVIDTLVFKTNDGVVTHIPAALILYYSKTIKDMVDDIGISDTPIDLSMTSEVLKEIMTYFEHHHAHNRENQHLNGAEEKYELTDFDEKFFRIPEDSDEARAEARARVYEILLGANYLHSEHLLNVGCQVIANMLKGRSVEQMRTLLGVVNDFTPEEEEKIRREAEWCEDRG